MPEKRRKSKNWRMSKKNAKIQAMRMKVPKTPDVPTKSKNRKHRARAVVITSQLLSTAAGLSSYISKSSSQRGVAGGRYTAGHSILTVGDGNFSFSVSLASALGGANIVATSYDSKREVLEKYASALENVEALTKLGVSVFHSVNATALSSSLASKNLGDRRFDRIIFNFPHAESQNVERQQKLLFAFFAECAQQALLTPRGEVHVTLRTTAFYESWDLETVGVSAGLEFVKKVPFKTSDFFGYSEVRTRGEGVMRQAPSIESAATYIFRAPAAAAAAGADVDAPQVGADTAADADAASHRPSKRKPAAPPTAAAAAAPAAAPVAKKRTRKQRRKAQRELPAFAVPQRQAAAAANDDDDDDDDDDSDDDSDDVRDSGAEAGGGGVDFFAEWVQATGGDVAKVQREREAKRRAAEAAEAEAAATAARNARDEDSSSIDDPESDGSDAAGGGGNDQDHDHDHDDDDDDDDDDEFLAELIFARRNRKALTADEAD